MSRTVHLYATFYYVKCTRPSVCIDFFHKWDSSSNRARYKAAGGNNSKNGSLELES